MVDENGRQTITNDGATVMKVHLYKKQLGNRSRELTLPFSFST